MTVAIIIATYNRGKLLEVLLKQILALAIPNDVSLKIIIINDGSTDGTLDMLINNFPNVKVVNGDGNWWWTKCINEGIKAAIACECTHFLLMNDDNEINTDYLKILIRDYRTLEKVSVLGSATVSLSLPHRVESAGTREFIKWKFKFVPYYKGFHLTDENFNGIKRSWTLSGRGTLISKEVIDEIGMLDEKLVQYGSDDEFCIRANLINIPVYISWNAIIYNHTNLTSEGAIYKSSFLTFIKSFFNKFSSNSLKKQIYLYSKYGYPFLLPFYLMYYVGGNLKAYFFNYRNV